MTAKWDYLGKVSGHMEHYRNEYGPLAGIYKRQVKSSLLKMVPMKGKVILEVGCGNGFLGEIAKEMGITITYGTDFTRSLLKYAKGKYGKVAYANVEQRLPFRSGSIDVVLLPEVIAHLKKKSSALKEIRRVLKTGGHMILTMPDKKYLERKSKVKMILKGSALRKPDQYFDPMYFKDLASLVEKNGFKVVKHYKTFHGSKQIMLAEKAR